MDLIRLIYVSTLPDDFDTAELSAILETARERNSVEDITGVLYYTSSYFFQCLEGTRNAVNRLYCDIVCDSRHSNPVILDYEDIKRREFPSWCMAYVKPDAISQEILESHCEGEGFNPYRMTRSMANAMILLLSEHLTEADGGT